MKLLVSGLIDAQEIRGSIGDTGERYLDEYLRKTDTNQDGASTYAGEHLLYRW